MSVLSTLPSSIISYLSGEVLPVLSSLLLAPLNHHDMLWMSVPLVIVTLAMALYFGRYVEETLGWNTAFGNSLILFFVAVDLVREIVRSNPLLDLFGIVVLPEFLMVVVIASIAVFLAVLDFFHKIPEDLAFFVSAPLSLNLIAYLGMAVVYANITLVPSTIIAGLILFLGFSFSLFLVRGFARVFFSSE